jgi:hypothetical protein
MNDPMKCKHCRNDDEDAVFDGVCWACELSFERQKSYELLNTLVAIYSLALAEDVEQIHRDTWGENDYQLAIVTEPKGKVCNYPWLPTENNGARFKVFTEYWQDSRTDYCGDSGNSVDYGKLENGIWLAISYSW